MFDVVTVATMFIVPSSIAHHYQYPNPNFPHVSNSIHRPHPWSGLTENSRCPGNNQSICFGPMLSSSPFLDKASSTHRHIPWSVSHTGSIRNIVEMVSWSANRSKLSCYNGLDPSTHTAVSRCGESVDFEDIVSRFADASSFERLLFRKRTLRSVGKMDANHS